MIVQAAGLAVLAAISPAVLVLAVVYLGSGRPRETLLAYLAGALLMSIVMGIVVLVLLRAGGFSLSHGAEAGPRRATIRTLAFPLSFLLCGLGFTGIFLQRSRPARRDMIAGTAVVYTWDARAARLRFLDRDASQNPR
jgi:hypothetical protein